MSIKKSKRVTDRVDKDMFDHHLLAETNLLEDWFANNHFAEDELEAGSETEFFILDEHYALSPQNLDYIEELNEPNLVPEFGAAQLEINSAHYVLSGHCLTLLYQNISEIWQRCCDLAHQRQAYLALIGAMPMVDDVHHQPVLMTPMRRFQQLQDSYTMNHGTRPFVLELNGDEDSLLMRFASSVPLVGLISAFQLHLKVGLKQSVVYYNTAQIIAGPLLALSSNAPYFYGQNAGSESRIGVLEQFAFSYGVNLDCFGTHYLNHSFFELFNQNINQYPRIIPEAAPDAPINLMLHVRRQNGTIYRWNRPVIDFNDNGKPHLRIEHRSPSVGPTVVDMIANAAFFYGITHYFATQPIPVEYQLPFHHAKKNFYSAARSGFNAKLTWFDGREVGACELIGGLVPLARLGLLQLGITAADVNYYLGIIQRRVDLKQNGSIWQQAFIKKYGKDFPGMLDLFLQNQYQEIPISDWKLKRCKT